MASQRKLGIYWGNVGISLVELNKDVALASTFISFSDIERNPVIGIAHLSEDLRLLELLQKALNSGAFSTGKAFLSFPSNDIIVRWFVIPWVKPDEIQGVVKFEAKKYLPFALEDLIFNYCPLTISVDGAKQIGIALTAIRKIHYERYTNVLVQAGINLVYSEPSSMSLLRVLVYRKIISVDQVCAIYTSHEDTGEISIVSQGFIKFIRDFSLRSSQPIPANDAGNFFKTKLFNEVRMSLDFFARNNSGPEVKKVIAVSSSRQQSLYEAMGEDIGIPVQMVDPSEILEKFTSIPSISYARAFGVALSGIVPAVVNSNLSEGQLRPQDKDADASKAWVIPLHYFIIAGLMLVLILLFMLCGKLTIDQIKSKEAAKQELSHRLGRYVDTPQEDIDAKTSVLKKKIDNVKSLPLKSSFTSLIIRLVQLIPEGIWFENIELINTKDAVLTKKGFASLIMTVSGLAYLGETNSEFELVNEFLDTINNDPKIKEVFPSIKLKLLQTQDIGVNQKVTAFTIEFK